MRLSLKLGALCAAAAIIPLLIVSFLLRSQGSAESRRRSLEQLRSDARVAGSLCEKRLVELRAAAQGLAGEIANRALVSSENSDRDNPAAWARLQDLLPRSQTEASLDFIIVTDPLGRVIARHNDKPQPDETLLGAGDKNPVADRVLAGGNLPAASCVVETGERSARLGLDRIAQVRLADGSTINSALMLEAGAPIFSNGRLVGMVLIAQLLNTYYKARTGSSQLQTPLVAEARQTLYRNAEDDAGAIIALGKAVVASSVPPDTTNESASGPALAGTVHDTSSVEEVYQQGTRSYSIAWQSLKAIDGAALGAIGIARPARELEASAGSGTVILLIGVLASSLAGAAGFLFGRGLGARLDDLRDAAGRWSLGELSTPARNSEPVLTRWISAEHLRDEVNHLAEQLDQMRESFRQAIERIRKR
jgi:HAMP domain-containing protein